ncbi:MAG: hypothetical protein GX781_08315, partial [Clostridiales bacterium]|nr:hypothetical protein [Clostridiales bacterium]
YGYNINATGRRNASTVFIMIVSGLILYLVYGIGARDLGEKIDSRNKWRGRFDKVRSKFSFQKDEDTNPVNLPLPIDLAADFRGIGK